MSLSLSGGGCGRGSRGSHPCHSFIFPLWRRWFLVSFPRRWQLLCHLPRVFLYWPPAVLRSLFLDNIFPSLYHLGSIFNFRCLSLLSLESLHEDEYFNELLLYSWFSQPMACDWPCVWLIGWMNAWGCSWYPYLVSCHGGYSALLEIKKIIIIKT